MKHTTFVLASLLSAAPAAADAVIAVRDDSTDKVQMWHKLHFDVVFKGDDWRGTPKGDRLEEGMASVGARVIYFPYTKATSSTQIRRRIREMDS